MPGKIGEFLVCAMAFPSPPAHSFGPMRRLLFWALPWLGLSTLIFASWLYLAVLDPSRVDWLLDGNDHGQAAIPRPFVFPAP